MKTAMRVSLAVVLLVVFFGAPFPAASKETAKFLILGKSLQILQVAGELQVFRQQAQSGESTVHPTVLAAGDQAVVPAGSRVEVMAEGGERQILEGPAEIRFVSLWAPQESDGMTRLSAKVSAFFASLRDGVRKLFKA